MRLKLLVARATMTQTWDPGDVIDVDEAEGRRLLETGQAERCADQPLPGGPVAEESKGGKPARRRAASLGP